jgi:2-dehydro-3-deoxy-D-arabinonate dehydratase
MEQAGNSSGMKIYKTDQGFAIESEGNYFISGSTDWDEFINRENLYAFLQEEVNKSAPAGNSGWLSSRQILAPIGTQEVWAAGVTYLRSKNARMEESKESGGATFYDKVYDADRPELFFKATARRVAGTNDYVRIRRDSTWDVPEPELALLISSSGKIVGYTIGNDMSSRSIEGENPLYLPQAKTYERCAGLGPCILVLKDVIPPSTMMSMTIERDGQIVFEGKISIDQMKRSHTELAGFLLRENEFPQGCFLMTGTAIVPGNDFTLQSRDVIRITIDPIGTLVNIVE